MDDQYRRYQTRAANGQQTRAHDRSFEDLVSDVYRHATCLQEDLKRIEAYIEAVSRKTNR
jgi:hypothetical protein